MTQLTRAPKAQLINNVVSFSAKRDKRIRLDRAKRQLEDLAEIEDAAEIADRLTELLAEFLTLK